MSESPNLHLDWEEELFAKTWRWFGSLRKRTQQKLGFEKKESETAFFLKNQLDRLRTVAQVFAGGSLVVRPAESTGGVRGRVLFLPQSHDWNEESLNSDFYLVRATLGGAWIAQRLECKKELECMLKMRALANELSAEYQGFREKYERCIQAELANRPSLESIKGKKAKELELIRCSMLAGNEFVYTEDLAAYFDSVADYGSPSVSIWGGRLSENEEAEAQLANKELEEGVAADASEMDSQVRDSIRRILLPEESDKEIMPEHVFEKIETLEKFNGGMRHLDGSDELEDHAEALEELDLREVVRGGPEVHSVLRADIDGLDGIPDVESLGSNERGICYDEWDEGNRCYKRKWATVYPTRLTESEYGWDLELLENLQPTVRKMRRRLEAQRLKRQQRNRQSDGEEVDISAMIEDYANRVAEQPGSANLYTSNPRTNRDYAVTVLLDLSLSADSWINNRRVLDVSREAILLLGEVCDLLGDPLQVLAFASKTRNMCRVFEVKAWKDSWLSGRAKLGALKPQGYTRIGPAIRHATAEIAKHEARKKMLLVISDGKPTDFDRYEGHYGIADVRQAVREAGKLGVHVHALGIDPKASSLLPTMFGIGGWEILRDISSLPESLVASAFALDR